MSSVNAPPVRVSVVMAVHNGERYLREAVDSVLGQTLADFEFLIVDDGSADGTGEILRSYDDPRIRLLVNEQNIGLTRSLNRGLRLARGEFIARQDADDISEPQRLERQVGFLEDHPEVALLGSWYSVIDAQGTRFEDIQLPCEHSELCWELLFANPFAHSAVMLRREPVLRQVGFYDETYAYAQDYELWCRIVDRFAVANFPAFLLRRRVHPEAMTWTYFDAGPEFGRLRIARLRSLLGGNDRDLNGEEVLPAAMAALYFGWATSLDPALLNRAAEVILALHRKFSEELRTEQAVEHRRALQSRISNHLVMLAVFCSSGDLRVRTQLLGRAWRLEPRVFLRARTLVRAARALAGAYLPRFRAAPAVSP